MSFRRGRRNLLVVNSKKHIVETSTVIAAVTNTVLINVIDGVDTYQLSDADGVPTGSKVNGIFFSIFIISEGGEIATEVPLADWYIIHNPGNAFAQTFDANNLPTPGATGTHKNKRFIIHTEKGLTGGGDASLAGIPMVFKGVITIPRKWRRIGEDDKLLVAIRTNFASKVCAQAIYKHFE